MKTDRIPYWAVARAAGYPPFCRMVDATVEAEHATIAQVDEKQRVSQITQGQPTETHSGKPRDDLRHPERPAPRQATLFGEAERR